MTRFEPASEEHRAPRPAGDGPQNCQTTIAPGTLVLNPAPGREEVGRVGCEPNHAHRSNASQDAQKAAL